MLDLRVKGIPVASLPQVLWPGQTRLDRPLHVFYCICDLYEPRWPGHCAQTPGAKAPTPPRHVQDVRVQRWVDEYPRVVEGIRDSLGRCPQHTFFYPGDEYDAEYVERIADLCRLGYGDVEVHLHHDGDTSETLREKLEWFARVLHDEHGMLRKDEQGRITYGFVHGNWALDNSRPDRRFCGVDDELTVLRETGCYADFTMPGAPSPCQTTTVNRIYYATDDPHRSKSHDKGIRAAVGRTPPADSLLMVQGPLAFDLSSRKYGLLPRLDNSDVSVNRPPTMERFRLWLNAGVTVEGRDDWIFIKVYTHGAQDPTLEMFLGQPVLKFHKGLRELAEANTNFRYYYVTAREMANLVHLAEEGIQDPRSAVDRWQTTHRDMSPAGSAAS